MTAFPWVFNFNPKQLSGLVGWFDMKDPSSFTQAGTVTSITNKASGVAWTEATNPPAYSATGLGGLYPCMDFDGATTRIISTEAAVVSALSDSNAYTLFYVAAHDGLDVDEAVFSVADATLNNNRTKDWGQSVSGPGRWRNNTVNNATTTTLVVSTGNAKTSPHIFCWTSPGTTVSLFLDGNPTGDPAATTQNPGTLTPTRAAMGCRCDLTPDFFFNGKISEVIIFSRNLNSAEIDLVNNYLREKWYVPSLEYSSVGWFDMQDASSYTQAGTVTAITNKITNVSWTEGSVPPTYLATGFNGYPCMDFNGTDMKIHSTTDTSVIDAFDADNPYTVFYVAKFDTLDRAETVFGVANSGSNAGFRGFGQNTTNAGVWQANASTSGAVSTIVESSGASNPNGNIFEWFGTATASLQVNGGTADPNAAAWVVGATGAVSRTGLGNRPRLANDHFFDGKLAEVLIYERQLSSDERTRVRNFLRKKWYAAGLENGLVGWFDMQDASSYTQAGTVTSITNKASGVAWAEATNPPAYSATGFNGFPCMDFDGSANRIQNTTDTLLLNVFNNDNAYTVFVVGKFDTVDRAETVFGVANSASNSGFRGFGQNTTNSGTWQFNATTSGGASTIVDSTGNSNSNNNIFEYFGTGTANLKVNGNATDPNAASWAVGATTANRASLGNRPRLANDHFFDGKLAELLVFSRQLSNDERVRVRNYLAIKWKVTIAS